MIQRTLAATLLACLGGLRQDPTPPPPAFGIELPPGPAGAAWSKVLTGTAAAQLTAEQLGAALPDAQSRDDAWLTWADDVRAEASAPAPDPKRRVQLALIAASQGRSDDAWEHLAALSAAPEWFAAAVPALLPGVPLARLEKNALGPQLALPDGVLLSPAFPPSNKHAADVVLATGRIEKRAMTAYGVSIGGAKVDIKVGLEYEGLQIELTHRSGPAVHVLLRLPEPIDFEITMLYVDWKRQDATDAPLDVVLTPGAETVTVFGHFQPRWMTWPSSVPSDLDVRARDHGFALAVRAGDERAATIGGLAHGLARLLGCPASVVVVDPAKVPPTWNGITLDLTANADRDRKLRTMISTAERFALARK